MSLHQVRTLDLAVFKRTALAIALAAASLAANALPTFTFDPSAVGLSGAAFTADNLLVENYSTVLNGASGTFTETGYLSITGASVGGAGLASTPGLNDTYGLYIQFSGTGHTIFGSNPMTGPTLGVLDTLTYTIYGYNGSADFGFTGTTPMTTAVGAVALVSGTLVAGTGGVNTAPSAPSFAPGAQATLHVEAPLMPSFFVSPSPFYGMAQTSFSNTSSQVALINGGADGFMIQQGGGSVNFAMVVPEPESYVMLASGLAVIAFLARRRGWNRDRR